MAKCYTVHVGGGYWILGSHASVRDVTLTKALVSKTSTHSVDIQTTCLKVMMKVCMHRVG